MQLVSSEAVTSMNVQRTGNDTLPTSKMAVILKYHDGGADHNITFASVQLASIVKFLVTGVD